MPSVLLESTTEILIEKEETEHDKPEEGRRTTVGIEQKQRRWTDRLTKNDDKIKKGEYYKVERKNCLVPESLYFSLHQGFLTTLKGSEL